MLFIVLGVEFMVAVTAPFYCQLCCSFSSNINEAQKHVLSVDHNEKYKVCGGLLMLVFMCYGNDNQLSL